MIPGGVNSPARAFGGVGGEPPFIARAEGAYLHDIDGHSYIDYVGSWGPMILGHAHPSVRTAVSSALELGSSFGAPTIREIEIAELVAAAVPSIEKVRFVSSGTEASMSAVRLARGATGRSKIIKMTGHYHGHSNTYESSNNDINITYCCCMPSPESPANLMITRSSFWTCLVTVSRPPQRAEAGRQTR